LRRGRTAARATRNRSVTKALVTCITLWNTGLRLVTKQKKTMERLRWKPKPPLFFAGIRMN
jgi:hypothetical protein